jgi:hypothetical protein
LRYTCGKSLCSKRICLNIVWLYFHAVLILVFKLFFWHKSRSSFLSLGFFQFSLKLKDFFHRDIPFKINTFFVQLLHLVFFDKFLFFSFYRLGIQWNLRDTVPIF